MDKCRDEQGRILKKQHPGYAIQLIMAIPFADEQLFMAPALEEYLIKQVPEPNRFVLFNVKG